MRASLFKVYVFSSDQINTFQMNFSGFRNPQNLFSSQMDLLHLTDRGKINDIFWDLYKNGDKHNKSGTVECSIH